MRDLVRRAKESQNALEVGVLYTQAAELAHELNERRRAPVFVRDAVTALSTAIGANNDVAAAHLRLAEAAARLGLFVEAMQEYGRAFALDRSQVRAVQGARAIALTGSAWAQAAQLFEEEIAVVADDVERASLICQEAILIRERLDDIDGAIALMRRAVALDPASVTARQELAATLVRGAERRTDKGTAARDREEAADALVDIADIVADEERVGFLDAALDVAPGHVAAITKLTESVSDEERLVPRWARHVEVLPDSPVGDGLRQRLAGAHLRAGRSEEALPYLEHFARNDDIESALLVIDIHARAGRTEAARAWGSAARDRVDGTERLTVLRHVFQALNDRDPAAANATARDIVREDPLDAVALDYCETYAAETEDWVGLESLLADAAAALERRSKWRVSILRKLAALRESKRGDLAAALATWRAIETETEDGDVRSIRDERLRLAERVGAWDEVLTLLEAAADAAPPAEHLALLFRIAAVHRDGRADPESAARAFVAVLATNEPVDDTKLLSELTAVLEKAGAASPTLDEVATYAKGASPARRATLYRMLARLFDAWNATERAFQAWTHVREADAADEVALGRLAELAIATSRHEHAITLLGHQVESAEADRAIAIHRRIAKIATDELGDHDRAADALTAALDLAPRDRAIAEALSLALERTDRYGEQLVILRLLASSAPDDTTRLRTKERIARIYSEKLRDEDEAIAVWEQIATGTRDLDALRSLADDARKEEAHRRLEVLLRRLSVAEPNAGARAEVALERAKLLSQTLDRVADAVALLFEVAEGDARGHLPALSLLESLAVELGDDRALARALEHQIALLPPTAKKPVLVRLADLYEGPLEDSALAADVLERWKALWPDDAEPRVRLIKHLVAASGWVGVLERLDELIAISPGEREQFVNIVVTAVEEIGAPPDERLASLFVALADRAGSVGSAELPVVLSLRAARTRWGIDHRDEAAKLFGRAVELARNEPGLLDRVESVAKEIGDGALVQVATVYQAAARIEPVPERRAILLFRHARLVLTVAGAKEPAFALLLQALALAPTDEALYGEIESIIADHGMIEALDDHLERSIEKTMSSDVAAAFLRRRARILHQRRGMPSEAADAYLRLWALRPNDPEVFRHLRVCLLETGRIHELISAAERELSQGGETSQQIALMREIARLWEEDAKNTWEARDAWKRVLDHVPGDPAATDAIARLGTRSIPPSERD